MLVLGGAVSLVDVSVHVIEHKIPLLLTHVLSEWLHSHWSHNISISIYMLPGTCYMIYMLLLLHVYYMTYDMYSSHGLRASFGLIKRQSVHRGTVDKHSQIS